jgi:hypothetical protein
VTGPDAVRVIADAEALVKSGRLEAALLWAWSAAEATLRLLAGAQVISSSRQDPAYLLKQLALEGEITREDYEVLMQSFRARNAVAHGFRLEEGLELEALVRDLLQATARLIHLFPDTQPARASYLNWKLARWKEPSLSLTTSWRQLSAHALSVFQE